MVRYETGEGQEVGCVVVLRARGDFEGELSIKQLEDIDKVMKNIGSSRTGQRIDVSTTEIENTVSVSYAYQETINYRSLVAATDRLKAITALDDPYITIDAALVGLVEDG